jgi:hypothetical protein
MSRCRTATGEGRMIRYTIANKQYLANQMSKGASPICTRLCWQAQ